MYSHHRRTHALSIAINTAAKDTHPHTHRGGGEGVIYILTVTEIRVKSIDKTCNNNKILKLTEVRLSNYNKRRRRAHDIFRVMQTKYNDNMPV